MYDKEDGCETIDRKYETLYAKIDFNVTVSTWVLLIGSSDGLRYFGIGGYRSVVGFLGYTDGNDRSRNFFGNLHP